MSDNQPREPAMRSTRYVGIGIEFAGAVGGFCLVGWWIDRRWEITNHWGLLICALLGLVGGMYNLVREAMRAARESERASAGHSQGQTIRKEKPHDTGQA